MTDIWGLVIGYGNTLRCDDGVGCYLADLVAQENWPHLRSQSVHQLTPELAAEIAEVDRVIFIDAIESDIAQIRVEKLTSACAKPGLEHHSSPQYLLALAEKLYDHSPEAWWVLIPGNCFELGEKFSPLTESCLGEAMTIIKQLIGVDS